jgi:hypothetical protein
VGLSSNVCSSFSKDHVPIFSMKFSLLVLFPHFIFLPPISLGVPISLVSPPLLCCFKLASIMAESSHYCQYCDRNSIHCLMYDIFLCPLLGANEVSGNGSWSLPCMLLWRSLYMHVSVSAVQTTPQFVFEGLVSFLFPCSLICCFTWNLYNLVFRSALNSIHVDFSTLMSILLLLI